MKEVRLLVVEDEPVWRDGFVLMYRRLFASVRPQVRLIIETAGDGQEAASLLRQNQYDLLSLDINLGKAQLEAAGDKRPRRYKGVDGRDLLELAKRSGCRGLIVITGFSHDDSIHGIFEFDAEDRLRSNEEVSNEVRRQRMLLGDEIARLWGPQHKFYNKDKEKDVGLTIETISPELTADVLTRLCRPTNRFARSKKNPAIWDIVYDGRSFHIWDYAGMHYIAQLLREPGREFTGTDLAPADPTETTGQDARRYTQENLILVAGSTSQQGSVDEALDPQAKREYKDHLAKYLKRAEEIEDKLASKSCTNEAGFTDESDVEELNDLLDKISWIRTMLEMPGGGRQALKSGPSGRAGKAANDRVRRGIQYCLEQLKREEGNSCQARKESISTPIHEHLKASVKFGGGTFSYKPESPVEWDINEPSVRLALHSK